MKTNNLQQYLFSVLFLFALIVVAIKTNAQNKENPNHKISVWFGVRDFNQPPLRTANDLDFFDYYISENWKQTNYHNIDSYLGVGYFRKWTKNIETDIRISINSALNPNSLFIRGYFYPTRRLGVSLSYYTYSQYLNDYSDYYTKGNNQSENTVRILTDQHPQWRIFDHNLGLGAVVPVDIEALHLKLELQAGVILLSPFHTSLVLGNEQSNYKALHQYAFKPSAAPFIKPEATLEIDMLEFNNKAIGLQIQTSCLWSKRSINYRRTSYEWTMKDRHTENIKSVPHTFKKFEFDAGFYYKF